MMNIGAITFPCHETFDAMLSAGTTVLTVICSVAQALRYVILSQRCQLSQDPNFSLEAISARVPGELLNRTSCRQALFSLKW